MNKVFDNLLKNVEKKSEVTQEISVGISDKEMAVLTKKAEVLGMEKSKLLREYLLGTPIFDNSPFEEKKGKKVVKKEVKVEDNK